MNIGAQREQYMMDRRLLGQMQREHLFSTEGPRSLMTPEIKQLATKLAQQGPQLWPQAPQRSANTPQTMTLSQLLQQPSRR